MVKVNKKNVVPKQEGEIYKGIPPLVMKQIPELIKEGKFYCAPEGFFPKANWDYLKSMSVSILQRYKYPFFLAMPFFRGFCSPLGMENDKHILFSPVKTTRDSIFFADNEIPKQYSILRSVDIPCYYSLCLIDGILSAVYSMKKFELSKKYIVDAVKIPIHTSTRNISSRTNITENIYLVTNFIEYKEDFSSLKVIIPNIKHIQDLALVWDFRKNFSLYSDDETYIILCNLMFMEPGTDAFDLILCGEGGTKKSTWCRVIERIFDEQFLIMTNATKKGLVPSFYGEQVKMGALMESKFITLLDDFFRFFSQNIQNYGVKQSIMQGLEQVMNILDRTKQVIPTGKGSLTIKYESSFFATDNFKFSHVIKDIYREDPALFRRYSFLLLSPETTEKTKSMDEEDMETIHLEIMNRLADRFGVKRDVYSNYKKLMKWMRNNLGNVRYDKERLHDIYNEVIKTKVYFKSISRALIKSIIVFNSVLRANSMEEVKFEAEENDYEVYKRLLTRLYHDFCTVVSEEENPIYSTGKLVEEEIK